MEKIIFGQEAICPMGLGRVVSVGNGSSIVFIRTYHDEIERAYEVSEVVLIDPHSRVAHNAEKVDVFGLSVKLSDCERVNEKLQMENTKLTKNLAEQMHHQGTLEEVNKQERLYNIDLKKTLTEAQEYNGELHIENTQLKKEKLELLQKNKAACDDVSYLKKANDMLIEIGEKQHIEDVTLAYHEKFHQQTISLLNYIGDGMVGVEGKMVREFLNKPMAEDLATFDISLMDGLKDDLASVRNLLYPQGKYFGADQINKSTIVSKINAVIKSYYNITKNGE